MDMSVIANAMTLIIALVISLSFHEAAHAWAAKWQGDDTAEREGRLTLNPLPHIDPMGTIAMPAIMILMGAPFLFGWAKPVPVNPNNVRNRKWGNVMIAAAGPLANLIICFISVLLITVYFVFLKQNFPQGHFLYPVILLVKEMILLNAILAVFNLLPFPPLDGGSIFPAFLPGRLREGFEDYIAPYGSFILIALWISGGLGWLQPLAMAYVHFSQALVGMFF